MLILGLILLFLPRIGSAPMQLDRSSIAIYSQTAIVINTIADSPNALTDTIYTSVYTNAYSTPSIQSVLGIPSIHYGMIGN